MTKFACALVILLVTAGTANAISDECNTVAKMAECCKLHLRSASEKLLPSELDMAHQCVRAIDGARDETTQEKYLNACVPAGVATVDIAKSFIFFSENRPDFYTRSPRFGLLYLMEFKWPCEK